MEIKYVPSAGDFYKAIICHIKLIVEISHAYTLLVDMHLTIGIDFYGHV